jgi:hypothetical protein
MTSAAAIPFFAAGDRAAASTARSSRSARPKSPNRTSRLE